MGGASIHRRDGRGRRWDGCHRRDGSLRQPATGARGWQFWVDDAEHDRPEANASSRSWRPTWLLYVAASIIGFFAVGVGCWCCWCADNGRCQPRCSPGWSGWSGRAGVGRRSDASRHRDRVWRRVRTARGRSGDQPTTSPGCGTVGDLTGLPRSDINCAGAVSHAHHDHTHTCSADTDEQGARALGNTDTVGHTHAKKEASRRHRTRHPRGAQGERASPKTGYDRDQFGSGWDTQPGGCDTRQTVLRRDLANVQILAADDRTVIGGKLNDPYTGAAVAAERPPLMIWRQTTWSPPRMRGRKVPSNSAMIGASRSTTIC